MRIYRNRISCLLILLITTTVYAQSSIILLGPPGSGKGTQSEYLKKQFKIPAISFGVFFRGEELKDSNLFHEYQSVRNNPLLKNQLKQRLFSRWQETGVFNEGLIFDSWPKDSSSLSFLKKNFFGNKKPIVIELAMPEELLIARAVKRVVCPRPECGLSFNTRETSSSSCEKCQTPLFKRRHDNPVDFPERVNKFFITINEIRKAYEEQGIKVHQVDAHDKPQKVFKKIVRIIDKQNQTKHN